ncbi:hypothetical protein EBU24_00020 [bacterium]|nr:hypothetical protein [bacterium]
MSIGIKENSREVLSVNLGFVKSSDHLRKCLWWITRDFNNTSLKVVLAIEDNETSNEIIDVLKTYSARCSWSVIKTTTQHLLDTYNLNTYQQSKVLAHKICDKFCTNKKIVTSSQIIYGDNCFKEFADQINNDSINTMNCYSMPLYVQVGLTDASSNLSNFLIKECLKFPIYNFEYPAKIADYTVKSFYETEDNKEIKFLDFKCFFLETNESPLPQIEVEFNESTIDKSNIVEFIC